MLADGQSRSACQIICSGFCLFQVVLNVALSFIVPLGFLWLLLSPDGPISTTERYAWDAWTPLSIIVPSPWVTTLIGCGTLPIGLPDALAHRWYGRLTAQDACALQRCLPVLRPRVGVLRHLACGTLAALFYVPAAGCVVRFVLGPVIRTNTLVLACATYIATIPIVVIPLGLLGFAIPSHYERVYRRMPVDGHPVCRLVRRLVIAPTC